MTTHTHFWSMVAEIAKFARKYSTRIVPYDNAEDLTIGFITADLGDLDPNFHIWTISTTDLKKSLPLSVGYGFGSQAAQVEKLVCSPAGRRALCTMFSTLGNFPGDVAPVAPIDRKAVCSRHGQAYAVSQGCPWCGP